MSQENETEKINSIARTLRVLTYICRQKNGARVIDVAHACNMSSPAIYNYLKFMEKEGFIYKDSLTGRFRAAYKIVDLASTVVSNNEITEMTYSTVVSLSEKLKTEVIFSLKEGDLAICVSKIGKSDSIPSITRVGMSFELYPTALGKAILAYLPDNVLREYLNRTELIPYTEYTVTSKKQLLDELKSTRKRGYALDITGEHKIGLYAIAVPVFTYSDKVIGSISVPIKQDIEEKHLTELFAALDLSAKEISRILGNQHLFNGFSP